MPPAGRPSMLQAIRLPLWFWRLIFRLSVRSRVLLASPFATSQALARSHLCGRVRVGSMGQHPNPYGRRLPAAIARRRPVFSDRPSAPRFVLVCFSWLRWSSFQLKGLCLLTPGSRLLPTL